MTNQIARLWTVVVGVVVFFLAWAAIAAHPWQQATSTIPASPRSQPGSNCCNGSRCR